MIIAPDYDIPAALQAREDKDASYFHETLPRPTLVNLPSSFPDPPPSQREGWRAVSYPPLVADHLGEPVAHLLVPPHYPLYDQMDFWFDDHGLVHVGQAPDDSLALEVRLTSSTPVPTFQSAYFPLLGVRGSEWLGARYEVFLSNGWGWGVEGTGGRIAGGLWAGGRLAVGLRPPWVQDGVTCRMSWRRITSTTTNARLYTYELNRSPQNGTTGGSTSGHMPDVWIPGQWQVLEYEARMNTPGFANGYARMWIDGSPVGEVRDAIWSLNNEWAWRGLNFDCSWQENPVPDTQFIWVRNMTAYVPPKIDQSRQTKELVVFVWLNAVEAIITLPPEMTWKGGTTESPGSAMQWFGGDTDDPGEPMKWYGGEN